MNKKKVLVVVGSTYPFDRLIKAVAKLDSNKFEVLALVDNNKYNTKKITVKPLMDYFDFQKKINWADIIISHAGAGTIIDILTNNKPIVLFPRLKKYGEAIDNHQLEICKAFEKKFGIKWTSNDKEIIKLVNDSKRIKNKKKTYKLFKEIKGLI